MKYKDGTFYFGNSKYTHKFGTHTNYLLGVLGSKRIREFFNIDQCKVFVETGTHLGNGVQWAVDSGMFDTILSTELHKEAFEISRNRFLNNKNVTIKNEDTVHFLKEVIPSLQGKTMIYLDAHFSINQYNAHVEEYPVPLIHESNIILNNAKNLSDIIVLVDDEKEWYEDMIDELLSMYRSKGMIDCYIDDTLIFCKEDWLKKGNL